MITGIELDDDQTIKKANISQTTIVADVSMKPKKQITYEEPDNEEVSEAEESDDSFDAGSFEDDD